MVRSRLLLSVLGCFAPARGLRQLSGTLGGVDGLAYSGCDHVEPNTERSLFGWTATGGEPQDFVTAPVSSSTHCSVEPPTQRLSEHHVLATGLSTISPRKLNTVRICCGCRPASIAAPSMIDRGSRYLCESPSAA
jgi:hypothetical protein